MKMKVVNLTVQLTSVTNHRVQVSFCFPTSTVNEGLLRRYLPLVVLILCWSTGGLGGDGFAVVVVVIRLGGVGPGKGCGGEGGGGLVVVVVGLGRGAGERSEMKRSC